ncbi:hypothetical protein FE773_05145 [Caminibacter mediatlanticus TB-2]|uniref:YhdP central domain-containing protein n=1 Tax=Caminibacter mediatlanticus TB-2 TaxID=391592 RepID=A0ABX5VB09_9BACT|nr:AsmA-like C-terminal domain-containing protein [Caminibacter mediatlanticus]QCT94582.1 hypothetical protein FE773_05145 [Caminibacter mediatlanticus TB-2]
MSNKKISIAAIIFVIIYFLLVIFISLFKGLTFHNIKFNNIQIKTLFIKIHNKIILKANSITIIPKQKVSKDITSIHKKVYYISKIISIFEELSLKNIKYKKILIPYINFEKNYLTLNSKLIKVSGEIKPYKNITQLSNLKIKYKNYTINNINGIIKYENEISSNITLEYLNNKAKLKAKLSPTDILTFDFNSKFFKVIYNKKTFLFNNLKITGKYNIKTTFLLSNLKSKKTIIKDKKIKIFAFDNKISLNKKNILFEIKKIYINKINKIKNLKIDYIKGTYFIQDDMLIISKNKKVAFDYKKYKINVNKNSLVFKNINNFSFISNKVEIKNDINITANLLKILKFNNFLLIKTYNNFIKNKVLEIYNDLIYWHNDLIEIPKIKGNYKTIPFFINNALINIKNKKAIIIETNINNIKFSPTSFQLQDNVVNIKTHTSNLLINKNFKEILSQLNINYLNKLTQIKGKNKIYANISYNLKTKTPSWNIKVDSNNSVFRYQNYLFSYEKLSSIINNLNSNNIINNLNFSYSNINILCDANITTTKDYLNAFTKIKNFNVYNILKMKNYFEKVVFDFKTYFLYFLNSQIYINLKNHTIFFLSLKDIIKYTIFKNLIKNGNIYLNYTKNIFISGDLKLKKPIFLNQKDPNLLHANIKFTNNTIDIYNQNINTTIKNYSNISIQLKNLDIYTNTLIDIYNQINTILPKDSKKENNSTLEINATNTIFTYNKHKFLSQHAYIKYDKNLFLKSKYKTSTLNGYTKQGYFLLEGKNYEKEELVPLLDFFNHFTSINLDFVLVKSPDNFYTGKVYINKGTVKELLLLNNIIAFLNTIPSILSLSSPGFSAKGYKIKEGFINYLYYKNILYFKQISIKGINLDFYGKGYIDLNKNIINLKLTAKMKMKIKKIPIVGKGLSYILFGKDGAIDVKIVIKGDLNNPKVTQDIGKSILLSPFELFKRTITLPFNIF